MLLSAACGKKLSRTSDEPLTTTTPAKTEETIESPAKPVPSPQIPTAGQSSGPVPPIYVFPDAPPRTRACAEDLADYLQKITGRRPELIFWAPLKVPERAIWVGVQPIVKRVFPDLDLTFQHPEEILIHAEGEHTLIAGHDRWLKDKMFMQGRDKAVQNVQQEYGTCNAIYTFLQQYLDVRWLGPGDLWTDYKQRADLSLPAIHYRYHPQFRSREGILRLMSLTENRKVNPDEEAWVRRQRLSYNSLVMDGGHGFTDWWEKYHKEHPEYFALLPNGKREPIKDPKHIKLCVSNPEVWKQWMVEVRLTLRENPSQEIFNASPNDGWTRGQCTCASCRAWDVVSMTDRSPNFADRNIRFANELARLLRVEYPDKDYYVKMSAYGNYARKLPVKTKIDDNVLIAAVHSFYTRDARIEEDYQLLREQFVGWNRISPHVVWRVNLPNYAGHPQGMPDIALKQSYDDIQFAAKQGVSGFWVDTYWGHWSTQLPQYYLLGQLVWDPSRSYADIMDDFYTRAYGPAAPVMTAYWDLMEQTRSKLITTYPDEYSFARMHLVYDQQWVNGAKQMLTQALALVRDDQKLQQRIKFHQTGLEMVEIMLELRRLKREFEQGETGPAIKAKIDQLWKKAQAKMDAVPDNAFNKGYLFKDTDSGKTRNMHYDNVPTERVLKAIENH